MFTKTMLFWAVVLAFANMDLNALGDHAMAKVTIKVIDENGKPIEGADARIYFERYAEESVGEKGLTNASGEFTVEGESNGKVSYGSDKEGYYRTHDVKWLSNSAGKREQNYGKWQPWNPTYEVVLKKIKKPIPMYAKRIEMKVPKQNESVGYDLIIGDWVTPYGKGIISDFIFFVELNKINEDNFDYKLTVKFSNTGDGIIPFEAPYQYGSALKSSQQAPVSGYKPEWIQTRSRKPGQYVTSNSDDKRNYYFRVRSKIDEHGNVIQAMYGKIYGDFMQFVYYVNPDYTCNIEFDSKKNLIIKAEDNPYDVKYNNCRNLSP